MNGRPDGELEGSPVALGELFNKFSTQVTTRHNPIPDSSFFSPDFNAESCQSAAVIRVASRIPRNKIASPTNPEIPCFSSSSGDATAQYASFPKMLLHLKSGRSQNMIGNR